MASPQPEPHDSPSILIVAALPEELDHPGVLHTGLGKLNVAYALTRELFRDELPGACAGRAGLLSEAGWGVGDGAPVKGTQLLGPALPKGGGAADHPGPSGGRSQQ
jgi:hypothetical protein